MNKRDACIGTDTNIFCFDSNKERKHKSPISVVIYRLLDDKKVIKTRLERIPCRQMQDLSKCIIETHPIRKSCKIVKNTRILPNLVKGRISRNKGSELYPMTNNYGRFPTSLRIKRPVYQRDETFPATRNYITIMRQQLSRILDKFRIHKHNVDMNDLLLTQSYSKKGSETTIRKASLHIPKLTPIMTSHTRSSLNKIFRRRNFPNTINSIQCIDFNS